MSSIEHNAYRLSLTLEITHIDAPRYGSKKTLPDNTHYGYVTLFRGSTVTDTVAIKYPKFRVFDIINHGMWNYHQHTESLQLLAGGFQSLINEQSSYFVAVPGFVTFDTCRTLRFLFPPGADPVADLILRLTGCDDPLAGDGERDLSEGYRGFPVATPFPDIAKFKADAPVSFLWRLESWYLVNPAVYIADNPTDTGDETEGEDEYPDPEQGDGNGDGDEFPTPSPPDPNRPIEDYTGGVPVPFDGKGQCSTTYTVTGVARVFDLFGEGVDYEGFFTASVLGPIRFVGRKTGIPGFGPTQSLLVVTGAQGDVLTIPNIGLDGGTGFEIADVEIVRQDGLPDNCYPNG